MNPRVSIDLLCVALVCCATQLHASDETSEVAEGKKAAPAKVFDIRSFGAIGDGAAMETEAVQKALDACHASGGGVVRIPAGDYQIGTIRIGSHVTLSLDYGASLLGSHDIADYPTEGLDDPREGGPRCLIYAANASNITIEGLGVIDGRGSPDSLGPGLEGGRPRFVHVSCAWSIVIN